ncbi:hypothetical protein QN277_021144 [Acacia crassicarpa]|uniref:Dirigent protein n=1 Tax=Acacia crassicarpa TaxID=499986 RepID=A0AAE1KFX6_9FABA|nr:hypothetical protein QN277_021144 [Acacia crassicarpa]
MAKLVSNIFIPLATVFVFFFSPSLAAVEMNRFFRNLSPASLGLQEEKLSHLQFYIHDILSGPRPTAVRVAEAPVTNTSSTFFGSVVMMDDPLTLGPDPNSKPVGRAQGVYASDSQSEAVLLMAMTFVFTEGKYNGSTLSILGRNKVFDAVREMPIVGGSGAFRFARGYVQAKTYTVDRKTSNAVLEYNVYVFHY